MPSFGSRYRVTEIVGSGGMATVWKAVDTTNNSTVAIKEWHPEHEGHAPRIRQNLRLLRQIGAHPHIVQILDDFTVPGTQLPVAVMEFIDGGTLDEALRAGPFTPERTVRVGLGVLEGVARAHEEGILHRDIKPRNVLLTRAGMPKLSDFDIAVKLDGDRFTEPGMVLGSGPYMSPEQVLARPVDLRSDVYAVGCLLYRMVAGRPPFEGDDVHLKHVNIKPPPLPDSVPRGLAQVIFRALEKSPDNRYEDVVKLSEALAGSLGAGGSTLHMQVSDLADLTPTVTLPPIGSLHKIPARTANDGRLVPSETQSDLAIILEDIEQRVRGLLKRVGVDLPGLRIHSPLPLPESFRAKLIALSPSRIDFAHSPDVEVTIVDHLGQEWGSRYQSLRERAPWVLQLAAVVAGDETVRFRGHHLEPQREYQLQRNDLTPTGLGLGRGDVLPKTPFAEVAVREGSLWARPLDGWQAYLSVDPVSNPTMLNSWSSLPGRGALLFSGPQRFTVRFVLQDDHDS